jgi:hypothetical protein
MSSAQMYIDAEVGKDRERFDLKYGVRVLPERFQYDPKAGEFRV